MPEWTWKSGELVYTRPSQVEFSTWVHWISQGFLYFASFSLQLIIVLVALVINKVVLTSCGRVSWVILFRALDICFSGSLPSWIEPVPSLYLRIPAGYVARYLLFLKIKRRQIHHLHYHDKSLYPVSELRGFYREMEYNMHKLLQKNWLGTVRYFDIKKRD